MSDDSKEIPTVNEISMRDGYNQTYVIFPSDSSGDDKDAFELNEVFFRCGNWCYKGPIDFSGVTVGIADLPILIPTLQRQQSSLRYYCTTTSISEHNDVFEPIEFVTSACEFIASEITSSHVDNELKKWSSVFSWIDDDNASTYFELNMDPPSYMKQVSLIASKTYSRGLIIIAIYFDSTLYFILQAGEGDQHLLDVRFPNVSSHGQGLHIASYPENVLHYKKLTLWHTLTSKQINYNEINQAIPKLSTVNLSSDKYVQTYCIMKSDKNEQTGILSPYHDVLFRFGSWCYSGKVQLTSTINLADIPYVIPALRMQQSKLNYFCDAARMPNASYFTRPMEIIHALSPFLEEQIYKSEETLRSLIDRLSKMGLGESVTKWLEGDATNSFFEFRLSPTPEIDRAFKRIELVASKCYHPSGIITITIFFQKVIYVSVMEGGNENPLLDSRFPDVSAKGRGYQLQSYPEGIEGWPSLRRVTIWQTVAALEMEFRERAAKFAEAKRLAEGRQNNQSQLTTSASSTNEDNKVSEGEEEEEEETIAVGKSFNEEEEEKSEKLSKKSDKSSSLSSNGNGNGNGNDLSSNIEGLSIADSKDNDDDLIQRRGSKSTLKSSSSDLKDSNSSSKLLEDGLAQSPSASRFSVARPHHVPKLESLSKKLDQIRAEMGEEGSIPNWNSFGKPLKKLGEK